MAIEPIEKLTRPLSRRGETQVASDPSPYDMSGWYDMYTDMQSNDELPDWMDSFDEGPNSFMQNLDVLDISPWDFVQRKGKKGTQMAMSDAPEDYLKRAVEQFIIDFPEFEDLQGQDLYDKMEEKGYFSDRYAMSEPQGVMQLASSSGLDIQASSPGELQLKIDALNWAMKTLGRNSWAEVL